MKLKHKICISLLSFLILIPIVANARYFEEIKNIKGKGIIAEPIFEVENVQNTIVETINKETNLKEYIFKIKNYYLENNNVIERISQVDMSYNIEVINEKENFPIKYELSELDKEENLLNEKGKTENFVINKDIKYEKIYKLKVSWNDKQGILENTDNIKIIVNSSQIK